MSCTFELYEEQKTAMKTRNFIIATLLAACLIGTPHTASAFWPFGKKKKARTEM